MFPALFSQIVTKELRRAIYSWKFPLQCLRPSTISVIIFVIVAGAVGDGGTGCPARCSCSTDDGFVNSLAVKCSSLGLSDVPVMLNLSTLHALDLSKNELKIIKNASFSSYSSLSKLILAKNKVEEIETNAFEGLEMMMEIDLSYNYLQSFSPKIFSFNPKLDTVSLRGNNLVYLSSDFPILISDSIWSLDLSSCSLNAIHPVTFSSLPSLYDLDLSSNNLQTLSISIFENVPELSILELNNNRWTCNCDTVEVLEWAESRREQQPAHQPVKCLEGQKYRTLWTVAGGNRSCRESKTAEPVVTTEEELKTITKSETGGLLFWNFNTLMVLVILPITLGVAVFVSLIAVHYVKKRCNIHRPQHHTQTEYNHLGASFSGMPLLNNQLTADITKHNAGYVNRSSDSFSSTQYHVYEHID